MDIDEEVGENEGLKANAIFTAASEIRCAYVHISKAIDVDEKRTPEALFSKTFALNTTIPKLRILSKSNWLENVASCATAESIISSAVLTHSDLIPGTVYKSVPVIATLEGGGVLVQLGGMGVKGFIPATHIFDKTSSGDNSYRNKIRMEKYKVGNKVDVRCLEVKPNEKKCIVTAKKSLLTTDLDDPVIDYEHIVPEDWQQVL
jgi:S1 RNA binding domain.